MEQRPGSPDQGLHGPRAKPRPGSRIRDQVVFRQALAGELISLANLVGRPIVDPAGNRVGRVSDVLVRWNRGTTHPPVVALLVKIGKGLATVAAGEVVLTQSVVRLRSTRTTASVAARQAGEVALAGDVLDHQLVDVTGVQVVRAADVYLARVRSGWELAGIDVGVWALLRRLWPKRKSCPVPDRALDWGDLQAFVPRFADQTPAGDPAPAAAAGQSGSSVQIAYPAAQLHRLRAREVAGLLSGLDRAGQTQLAELADTPTVAEALADLDPAKVDALLGELDEADRAKLRGLLSKGAS
jgi:sporulation protein YlmC with PRC-barrel domain